MASGELAPNVGRVTDWSRRVGCTDLAWQCLMNEKARIESGRGFHRPMHYGHAICSRCRKPRHRGKCVGAVNNPALRSPWGDGDYVSKLIPRYGRNEGNAAWQLLGKRRDSGNSLVTEAG